MGLRVDNSEGLKVVDAKNNENKPKKDLKTEMQERLAALEAEKQARINNVTKKLENEAEIFLSQKTIKPSTIGQASDIRVNQNVIRRQRNAA
jgi:hypothetical protein